MLLAASFIAQKVRSPARTFLICACDRYVRNVLILSPRMSIQLRPTQLIKAPGVGETSGVPALPSKGWLSCLFICHQGVTRLRAELAEVSQCDS